jgi:hypothetical protein
MLIAKLLSKKRPKRVANPKGQPVECEPEGGAATASFQHFLL